MDDEPDVAELFRERFRRETHQDTYVLHYATSGAEVLDRLAGEIEPTRVAVLSDINTPCMDGLQLLVEMKQRFSSARCGRKQSRPHRRQKRQWNRGGPSWRCPTNRRWRYYHSTT